jgi:membrane protein implicated in regulation of membrane protease activity
MSKSNWLALLVAALELPSRPGERNFWARLAMLQLVYSIAGLLLGLTCIVGGILLFFHGVTGSSSWVGQFIGLQSKLSDAAPGTVLFVAGVAIVYLTRFEVRVREEPEHTGERTHTAEIVSHRRKAS